MKKAILFLSIILTGAALHSYGQAGVLDPGFGTNGMATFYQSNIYVLNKYALQQDGKIIAGGYTLDLTNSNFCLARFHTDGSIDSTFGTDGVAIIPASANQDVAYAIAVQPDDKIVIGGHSTGIGSSGVAYFSVARCNANGTIDSSFADNGVKIISLPGTYSEIRCIAVEQDSSKIILAGIADFLSSSPNPAVVRLKSDGSFDSSFADNGVYVGSNTDSWFRYPQDVKLQTDNKIVLVSAVVGSLGIVRLNEDGTLDNSFGTGGYVVTNVSGGGIAATVQPDGKILELGAASTGGPNIFIKIVRYNTDGTMDNTFGTNGVVTSIINNFNTEGDDIKVQPADNKIVIAGLISPAQSNGSQSKFLVMRLNPNGSLDTEFGTSQGYTATQFDNSTSDGATNVYILNDGKIFVGGTSYAYTSAMARYNSCSISVTNQPADQTVQAGTTASFTVGSTSPSATYQWQTMGNNGWEAISNGGQYSGVQTATLHIGNVTAANDQQQFRSVAASGVCTDTSDAATLTVTPGTGIDEIAAQTGVRLYPNPVSDLLTVEFHNPDYKVDQIRITDALGRVMETLKVSVNKTVTILSGSWPAGIYMVEVIPEKECPVTFRVIKQ